MIGVKGGEGVLEWERKKLIDWEKIFKKREIRKHIETSKEHGKEKEFRKKEIIFQLVDLLEELSLHRP